MSAPWLLAGREAKLLVRTGINTTYSLQCIERLGREYKLQIHRHCAAGETLTCPTKTCVAPPTLPEMSSMAMSFRFFVGGSGYKSVALRV